MKALKIAVKSLGSRLDRKMLIGDRTTPIFLNFGRLVLLASQL